MTVHISAKIFFWPYAAALNELDKTVLNSSGLVLATDSDLIMAALFDMAAGHWHNLKHDRFAPGERRGEHQERGHFSAGRGG